MHEIRKKIVIEKILLNEQNHVIKSIIFHPSSGQ